jgi:hypothetical protein
MGGARVSRLNASPARTERVCGITDSFAGFAESNGGASSASLCKHTTRSLSVAELRPPCYPKSSSHVVIVVVIEKLPQDERDTKKMVTK